MFLLIILDIIMKRINTIIILFVLFFTTSSSVLAIGYLDFAVTLGLSTPNSQISNIYNRENMNTAVEDKDLSFLYGGLDLGWNLGINVQIELKEDINLNLGFAWHKFPENNNYVDVTNVQDQGWFKASTSIIPVTVGLDYYLLHSFIGLYIKGDLAYNHISSNVNTILDVYDETNVILTNTKNGRFGCGLGMGAEFDAGLLRLALEAKYNWLNLIGKIDGEPQKEFLSLSVYAYL